MSGVFTAKEIYKRLYPEGLRVTEKTNIEDIQRLYKHCESITPLVEGMEKSLLKTMADEAEAEHGGIDVFHQNVLDVASQMMGKDLSVTSGIALRIAAAVINRGCNPENLNRALQIFNEYDLKFESELDAYEEDADIAHAKTSKLGEGKIAGATASPTVGAVLMQCANYEMEMGPPKLLALASIRPGTKIATLLHQGAVEYLVTMADDYLDLYQKMLMLCGYSFLNAEAYPAGMKILEDSYRGMAINAEASIAKVTADKKHEEKQYYLYDLINLHTDMIFGYHDVPALFNQAKNLCREHWGLLKAINHKEAHDFLAKLDFACSQAPVSDDSKEGKIQLCAFFEHLRTGAPLEQPDGDKARLHSRERLESWPTISRVVN